MLESTNLSRDYLSKEIRRASVHVCRARPVERLALLVKKSPSPGRGLPSFVYSEVLLAVAACQGGDGYV